VVWVANEGNDTVTRIATGTGRKTTIKVGRRPYAVAHFEGYVWVANRAEGTVMRLDPKTGKRVGGPISVPGEPVSLATLGGYLVVTANRAGTLTRIKP
jgi:YVTN family beta-propeller protein